MYKAEKIVDSHAPSLDSQIPINIERLWYYMTECDDEKVKQFVNENKKNGFIQFEYKYLQFIQQNFLSEKISNFTMEKVIKNLFEEKKYFCDPHSSTSIYCALLYQYLIPDRIVSLCTAHPSKFHSLLQSILGQANHPVLPKNLSFPPSSTERCLFVDNSQHLTEKLKQIISKKYFPSNL